MRGGGAPLFPSFKITKIKRDPYFDMKSSHIHPMYEIQDCLQELIIFLIRYKRDKRDGYIQDIDTTDRLMQEAAKYIRDNFMYELSLASVAKHVNLSPTYLSKKFKSSTGFGCWEYIVLVRVQAACVMLLETNKSITEIATACGFRNSNYFGDVFKKEKGISPLQYRKTIG